MWCGACSVFLLYFAQSCLCACHRCVGCTRCYQMLLWGSLLEFGALRHKSRAANHCNYATTMLQLYRIFHHVHFLHSRVTFDLVWRAARLKPPLIKSCTGAAAAAFAPPAAAAQLLQLFAAYSLRILGIADLNVQPPTGWLDAWLKELLWLPCMVLQISCTCI